LLDEGVSADRSSADRFDHEEVPVRDVFELLEVAGEKCVEEPILRSLCLGH
jgi:hypothetical protein